MRIVINCSTLSGTGVTQVAVSFIRECVNITSNEYHVFLSKTVANELKNSNFPSNFFFYTFESHPIYGIKGFTVRKRLRQLEKKINPDCVFSVFGPSWWTPVKPHLIGYAYPHYVYQDSPFFKHISFIENLKINIFRIIHVWFLKRNAKYFVCETEDVSERLTKLFNWKRENIFTVSNTYNDFFNSYVKGRENILPERTEGEFRFLSLCSFAPHKNLVILNKVIPLLNSRIVNNKIKFILTVDVDLFKELIDDSVKSSIINLGRVDVDKCPQLYDECDALFLPTTLECFSANYPEAMQMKKPIITSDLSFATSICKDAALYFDPYDENDIVDIIDKLTKSTELIENLVKSGSNQLNIVLTPRERAEKYLDICREITN